jgi:hypothetical protein
MAASKELRPCGIGPTADGTYGLLTSDGATLVNLGKDTECQTLEGALKVWEKKLSVLNQEVERYERSTAFPSVGIVREDMRPERDATSDVVQALKKCLQRQLGSSIR